MPPGDEGEGRASAPPRGLETPGKGHGRAHREDAKMLCFGQQQRSSPEPRFGYISDCVVLESISKATSFTCNPCFLWFPVLTMTETDA